MKLRADIDKTSVKYKQYMMKKAALLKIAVFLSALVIGAFVSLLIPLRPEESLTEKRKLSPFPSFSIEDFLDGTYFAGIDMWFSDTFPGRDGLIACNEKMTDLYGIRKNVIHGEVVKGDDIPDSDIDEAEFDYLNNIISEKPTEQERPDINYSYDDSVKISADDIGNSVDADDNSTENSAKAGESLGSIFVVGDSAYNYYTFSKAVSDEYEIGRAHV